MEHGVHEDISNNTIPLCAVAKHVQKQHRRIEAKAVLQVPRQEGSSLSSYVGNLANCRKMRENCYADTSLSCTSLEKLKYTHLDVLQGKQ